MSSAPVVSGETPALYHRGQGNKYPHFEGSLSVDWLSVTGPATTLPDVESALWALLPPVGSLVPQEAKGRKGYERGVYFPGGVELQIGSRSSDRWWLQIQGGACGLLGFDRLWSLARAVMVNATCTRLDVCCDVMGPGLSLVGDVIAACEAGFVRGPSRYSPMVERDADTGALVGQGVYVGSRASTQFVRCYDKGLQQGSTTPGLWHRYELQLRKEHAQEAMCQLLELDGDDLRHRLFEILVGFADFRDGPRARASNARRLPRCAFWDRFAGGVQGIKLRPPTEAPEFQSWCEALRVQYGALLVHAARLAGVGIGEAAELLLNGCQVNEGTRNNEIGPVLADWLRSSKVDTLR